MVSKICALTRNLLKEYPDDVCGSYAGLYNDALRDGAISQEEYDEARAYYGKMWNYAGD